MSITRREVLERFALALGAAVLLPSVASCGAGRRGGNALDAPALGTRLPLVVPAGWDPIVFNRVRGNQGAIPEDYLPVINGKGGSSAHIGQHLPYVVNPPGGVPEGYVALMWGDPAKGHAPHTQSSNAVMDAVAGGPAHVGQGHRFDWIRIRQATPFDVDEVQSSYSDWPTPAVTDNGAYRAFDGDDIRARMGVGTVYLAALPEGVKAGDLVRVHAHCTKHGEYVDFVQI